MIYYLKLKHAINLLPQNIYLAPHLSMDLHDQLYPLYLFPSDKENKTHGVHTIELNFLMEIYEFKNSFVMDRIPLI